MPVVFPLDKFRSYLTGSKIIIFTDHSVLKYLLSKKDAKPRLIRWIPLFQEFDLEMRGKKGVKNVMADYLSRLVISDYLQPTPIRDQFPDEPLFSISQFPWYADIANYLVTGTVPEQWSQQDRKKFFTEVQNFSGMTLISLSIAHTKLLGDVCQTVNKILLSHFVTHMHVEVIFHLKKLLLKFRNVDFTGHQFLKMSLSFAKHVSVAKN